MPVPTKMADIPSQTASACYPTGAEVVGNNMDDYIRSLMAIVRSTNAISTSTIASASTCDIALSDAERVQVTGTTTITSFGSSGSAGLIREVHFASALTINASANIILPSSTNITTVAGDVAVLRYEGSGIWRLTSFSRTISPVAAETVTALSISAGAVTINLALGNMFTITLNQNITSTTFTNVPAASKGQGITIEVKQDATGGRTWTWPASVKWSGGTYAPTATASAVDEVSFRTYDQGTTYRGTYAKAYA